MFCNLIASEVAETHEVSGIVRYTPVLGCRWYIVLDAVAGDTLQIPDELNPQDVSDLARVSPHGMIHLSQRYSLLW